MAYQLKLQEGDKVIVWHNGKWIESYIVKHMCYKDWVGFKAIGGKYYLHCMFINSPDFNYPECARFKRIVIKKVSYND